MNDTDVLFHDSVFLPRFITYLTAKIRDKSVTGQQLQAKLEPTCFTFVCLFVVSSPCLNPYNIM